MANFGGQNEFYSSGDNSYNFDMPEFDQELDFQNFENTQTSVPPNYDLNYANTNSSGMSSFYDPSAYSQNAYDQSDKRFKAGGSVGNDFEDEPPLLEELGINPNHIFQKEFKYYWTSCAVKLGSPLCTYILMCNTGSFHYPQPLDVSGGSQLSYICQR
uniref:Uncharacterized protein n=1 Tax=Stomoxys calcitrans TaxID=35570 RepID=A0A1I8P2W5_STOCA